MRREMRGDRLKVIHVINQKLTCDLVLAAVYCECSPETLRIPTKSFHP